MEKMYQDYKDIVEFRMVYINEAHAADSNRAAPYAKEKGINNHTNYGERCTSAQMLMDDKSLTIPCLIDGMDNAVNKAYSAWPDRVFLIRPDGRLAVAAERGPFGFGPAVNKVADWLAGYKKTGKIPGLSEADIKAADERARKKLEAKKAAEKSKEKVETTSDK